MRRPWSVTVVTALALATFCAVPSPVSSHPPDKDHFKAKMEGKQEAPVCVTDGAGQFEMTISPDDQSVSYTLSYDLEGTTVQQAHIHIGQKNVSGGITVWLCQSPPGFVDPTGLAPVCPATPNTVTGTFSKANVVGPAGQGIAGGAGGTTDALFAELIGAIRAHQTYANVHSNICPGGEIRGQIK
jgi:hypothetical protein